MHAVSKKISSSNILHGFMCLL